MLNSIIGHPAFAALPVAEILKATPLGFIDIGARGELQPLVRPLAGVTAVLGFEPDQQEAARLQAEGPGPWAACRIEPWALGAKAEQRTLYRYVATTNDSLRLADPAIVQRYGMAKFELVGQTPLETVPLDQVLFDGEADTSIPYGEFIKVDTQGTELEILQGAVRTLAERTVALVVEVEFFPVYEGQPLFSDVEQFLRRHGFAFYGFTDLHHRSCRHLDKRQAHGRERLMWSDAIFLRDPFAGGAGVILDDRRTATLFACSLLLGYGDLAVELAARSWGPAAGKAARTLALSLLANDAKADADAVHRLARAVEQHPDMASLLASRFVDRRRHYPDIDDVVLPDTLETSS